jgi:hypothetical protein
MQKAKREGSRLKESKKRSLINTIDLKVKKERAKAKK